MCYYLGEMSDSPTSPKLSNRKIIIGIIFILGIGLVIQLWGNDVTPYFLGAAAVSVPIILKFVSGACALLVVMWVVGAIVFLPSKVNEVRAAIESLQRQTQEQTDLLRDIRRSLERRD